MIVTHVRKLLTGIALAAAAAAGRGAVLAAEVPAAKERTAKAPAAPLPPDHAEQMARGLEIFKTHVRGVLTQQCIKCHGGEKTKGELDLTSRDGLLKGGSQGPAVIPGKAAASLLVHLIRHDDEPAMPEDGDKLPDDMIETFGAWIDAGAPYDGPIGGQDAMIKATIKPEARRFWSFQPLHEHAPPAVRAAWCRTPLDKFVLARLEAKGLVPRKIVDRRKLIRRASYDLIGLPPTPEEIESFLADTSPDAYEKLVDRLLASPHYGERWARHWLDLARFAESHGYEQDYDRPTAYHYRDFVIKALNEDMPYDRFVKLQVAGDELEPDNPQAMMATGFLGAGVHATQITASQVEKERYDEMDDMAATIGTSMLGLTIGCARCHDHKFDPIPQADYYRVLSTFTTTVRSEIDVDLDPNGYRRAKNEFDREHAPLAETLAKYEREQLPARFDEWLKMPGRPEPGRRQWLVMKPYEVHVASKAKLAPQPDGSLLASGENATFETYDLKFDTPLERITAIRIEALPDGSLPHGGPGRAGNGNFALSELKLTAVARDSKTKGEALKFSDARATFEQEGFAAANALDKTALTAWAVDGNIGRRSAAVFKLKEPLAISGGAKFTVSLNFSNNVNHALGRLRISVSTAEDLLPADVPHAMHDLVAGAARVLAKPAGEWSAADRESLRAWYATIDPECQKLRAAVAAHLEKAPRRQLTKVLVTSEGLPPLRLHTQGADFFEQTYFLKRGDLAHKQGIAAPGFLQVATRGPETRWQLARPEGSRTSHRRSALGRWLTDVESGAGPLLARVMVNRLWQHHLGRGIVSTPSDFGAQGERPTHPELLDALALELVREGWRLKPLHKLIMTSAVYMQSCEPDAAAAAVDPDNRLLWRRDRSRLEGEVIRDAMLAIGGSLDRTMFGPGSLDEGQPRRSVYFTIKRSRLIPMMMLFDGPDTLQGLGRRAATTVAPQALALMNNPNVRRYARGFAERMMKHSSHPQEAINWGYIAALGRGSAPGELADAMEFITAQTASYAAAGNSDAQRLAMTDFAQALMSLNEFVYVE